MPTQHPVLSWPGKTDARYDGVHELRVLEEHGALRWRNLLVRGDNLPVLSTLLHGPLREAVEAAGGIRLMYIDPPFAVGTDFCLPVAGMKMLAYRDCRELSAFLCMLYERLSLIRDLLAKDGSLYLHCDWRLAPHLRLVLDEIFGAERFLGDIVWHYTGGGRSERYFSRKHDRLLHYAVSKRWIFNADAVRVPYKPGSGYAKHGIVSAAGKRYAPNPLGTPVDDVWDIPMVNPMAAERLAYPTQKPERLLERVIRASSDPGDLVADVFCGSGGFAAVAEALGRRWLAVDAGRAAIHTSRKRLLARGASFVLAELAPAGEEAPFAPDCVASAVEHPKRLLRCEAFYSHEALLVGGVIPYAVGDLRLEFLPDGEGFALELAGFAVREREGRSACGKETAAFQALLDRGWRAFLDYWSVGFAVREADAPAGTRRAALCNRVFWQSGARRQDGHAVSPVFSLSFVLGLSGDAPPGLVLTLIDVFANESRFLLPSPWSLL